MATTTKYPMWDVEARGDAHAMWARMREEDPVYETVGPLTGNRLWLVTRYEDCEFIIRHPRIGKEVAKAGLPPETAVTDGLLSRSMIAVDPPDHSRLRRLVNKAFTPRVVARLEPRIRDLVDQMLDVAAARGHLEVIADLAFPLPVTVIAELLGIPADDREQFRAWSRILLAPAADPVGAQEASRDFAGYLTALIDRRRTEPEDDLLSALTAVQDEGEQLDHDEMLGMVVLLLIAGHETTMNLIGNGVLALLEHPAAWQELVDDPSLAPAVVEEVLRYDGPVEVAPLRFTYEDIPVAGATIPRGGLVAPVLLAANRDPQRFESPDIFDIHRQPRHLAFGHGIHFCLGAPLARLEGAIVFEQLARRFPSMAGSDRSELRWNEGLLMRGLTQLPVRTAP